MQFCIDQENIKYQSILYLFCVCHPMLGTQQSEKFWLLSWLRGSWVWDSDKPAIHGHAPPEPCPGADMATWIPRLLFSQWFPATPCDTWMSLLRARPQTEPSCKGLSGSLWVETLPKVHSETNSQGYKKSEAAARPPLQSEIRHLQGIENFRDHMLAAI